MTDYQFEDLEPNAAKWAGATLDSETAPAPSIATLSAYSSAISAKRQADAMEQIAKSLERLARAEYHGAILTQPRGGR